MTALTTTAWTESELERRALAESGRSVTAHLKRDAALIGWAKTNGLFVRIDRATIRGNPFVLGSVGDRDTVIAAYARYLEERPQLLARLPELRGRVLACWCHPRRCHGDALIARAYAFVADLS